MERLHSAFRNAVPMTIAVTLMLIFAGQLVAETGLTAEGANAGPSVVIVKLMDDEDVDWAAEDIVNRLEAFISDDPWIKNRIRVVETDDPSIVLELSGDIIIYVSHGGLMSLVTGDHLTSWKEMAKIVEASPAILHQFAVCFSSKIIQYGSDAASQYVYGVPGRRPAEFMDIDIAANVMLALGMDSSLVQEYRERDILLWKEKLGSGMVPHMLSFNYVTFDAIADANAEFEEMNPIENGEDSIEYWCDVQAITSLSSVPDAVEEYVTFYWANSYDSYGNWHVRNVDEPDFVYNRTWVTETIAGVPATYFENGVYQGSLQVEQYGQVDITAGGTAQNDVEWMNLGRPGVGQFYVSLKKTDGVWQEGTVERRVSETGNMYSDSCVTPMLEYDSTWPVFSIPGFTDYQASGVLVSEGNSYTVNSIAAGTGWHGPSFVRPLPFAFRMQDFGAFKADLGLLQTTDPSLYTSTVVALYDQNRQLALSLKVYDDSGSTACTQFVVGYHQSASVAWQLASPSTFYAGRNGTLQIFLDGDNGLRVDMPDRDPSLILWKNNIDMGRVIKYIAIQSYTYSTYGQSHEVIANISVSCVGSEYDVFFYDCQSTAGWISEPSSTDFEEPRTINTGVLHATDGYLYADGIPSGAPWKWGPLYVRELPQQVPIAGIRLFEAVIELTYLSGNMGDLLVCLFDNNKEQVVTFVAYDSQAGSSSSRYLYFCKATSEGGQHNEWLEASPSGSWKATFKFWYDTTTGSAMSSVDDGTPLTHTHLTDGAFDPSRPVKYIGVQFARTTTYPYYDYRLKLHSIKLEAVARNFWFDDCGSTEGWVRQSTSAGFEAAYQINDSGTLYTSGGYLYADGIASGASWKWGPLFVKEIPGFVRVQDIVSFAAQIQFSSVGSRMGDLCVQLFDENKQLATTFVAYDSWGGATTRRYLSYYKTDGEGGAYDTWLEQELTTSWTAKYQFYCDSTTKAAMSGVDDGTPQTHTHFTEPNYDESRIIRYVGIQFARATTYTYNGAYLKLDFLRLVYNEHHQEFNDPCSDANGWTKDLAWPNTTYPTSDGDLVTGGSPASYLQASISSYSMEKGPFWYKELAEPVSVNQFSELAVQLQNPGTGTRGGFYICLYDEDKVMVTRVGFGDYSVLEAGGMVIMWYQEDGDPSSFCPSLDQTQQSWDMTLRLGRIADNTFVGLIPGFSPVTILSADDWAMESSRIIKYVGIQWVYMGSSFNNIRLKDVMLRSGYSMGSSEGGYLPSSDGLTLTYETPPPEPITPPTYDAWLLLADPYGVGFGYWPEYHTLVVVGNTQTEHYCSIEDITDLLMQRRMILSIDGNTDPLTPSQVQSRGEVLLERLEQIESDPEVVLSKSAFSIASFACFWASVALAAAAATPYLLAAIGVFSLAAGVYSGLGGIFLLEVAFAVREYASDLDPFDRAHLFFIEAARTLYWDIIKGLTISAVFWPAYALGIATNLLFGGLIGFWILSIAQMILTLAMFLLWFAIFLGWLPYLPGT